jgi:predicted RNA binding protein YcfA (HicA-like mRNA interferase family)
MKTPRDLSGRDLVKALCRHWDYSEVGQRGSHIFLQTESPRHQRITVPAHRELRVGTLHAILDLVAEHKGVSRDTVLNAIL